MQKLMITCALAINVTACTTTETAIHSFNGETVEVELYGDTFAYGTKEQQQAQLEAAQAKAAEVCGSEAKYLSRRLVAQPQNGMFYVASLNLALFQCM